MNQWEGLGEHAIFFPSRWQLELSHDRSIDTTAVRGQRGLGWMPDHTSSKARAQERLLSASLSLKDLYEDKIKNHLSDFPPSAGCSINLGHRSLQPAANCLVFSSGYRFAVTLQEAGAVSSWMPSGLSAASLSPANIPRRHPHPSPVCHPSPSKLTRIP